MLISDRPPAVRELPATRANPQCAEAALLVRPARFGFNPQTADSNHFQQPERRGDAAARACEEFDGACTALAGAGLSICVLDDTAEPPKPDAIFPNNWVSWHRDGTVVLYPMQAPNRRSERRLELIDAVAGHTGFVAQRLIDLSVHEAAGRFLEGTGSLVLDHAHRTAFACRSARTDESLVHEWARLMRYEQVVFDAHTRPDEPIYHTNVLLAIGTHWVVVCTQAIVAADRARVLQKLRAAGRELIEISPAAMQAFAANLIELRASEARDEGPSVLVLSQGAGVALRAEPGAAWSRLAASVDRTLELAVPTIEQVGGGGVRCMLAEVPASTA